MKFHGHTIENWGEPYIIAELGANHNGDMELARTMIRACKDAGAHCVKFQSWTKHSVFSRQVYEENHFLEDDYRNRDDYDLEEIVEAFAISEDQLVEMRDFCNEIGIGFATTPFDQRELDFSVDVLGVEFIKIASMDCNNYPFLEAVAKKGVPVMLSTGLCTLDQIDRAVRTMEEAGNRDLVLLHCVANYPPKDTDVNLRNIAMLRDNYPEYPIGFSDHSLGCTVPVAAFACGACVLEKHFTMDKELFGWDHKVSATPDELKQIVEDSKRVQMAMGSYRRVLTERDVFQRPHFCRSLVSARPIKAGAVIEAEDLTFKRPGTGFPPEAFDYIIGRTAKRDIPFDRVISSQDV